jgi:5'-nucleotidase
MQSKPLILVTNDDGMFAPGIKALVEIAQEFGEIVVVAPDSPQSGQGHAITIEHPLRLNKVKVFQGIDAYECNGTPVDCVKLAKHILLRDRKIDLCLSGINHGSNASINIIYSGTMSAAMEASLEGIPSIGFSLLDYSFEANFQASQPYLRKIVRDILTKGMEGTRLLNVNIPKLPYEQIKGVKVCRQSNGRWEEEFLQAKDPRGQPYYWLTGKFVYEDNGNDSDMEALQEGYISIVPSHHDLTKYEALQSLKYLEK